MFSFRQRSFFYLLAFVCLSVAFGRSMFGGPLTTTTPQQLERSRPLEVVEGTSIQAIRSLPQGGFVIGAWGYYGTVITNDWTAIWPFDVNGLKFPFAIEPDGRFVCLGDTNHCVIRLNLDRTIDPGFQSPALSSSDLARIQDVQSQPEGKVLVGSRRPSPSPTNFPGINSGLFRLNANGSVDPTFQFTVPADVYKMAVLPDRKILASTPVFRRYLPDGQPDPTFHVAELRIFSSLSFAVQSDGKIVVAGATQIDGVRTSGLARLNADGTLDETFNPTNIASSPVSVKIQSDGKILVATGTDVRRWFPNGLFDHSFQQDRPTGQSITAMDIDASDRIYFNQGQALYQFSGQFRVHVPAADLPVVLEKSNNISSGWLPVTTLQAGVASEYIDRNFPGFQNVFYRLRPAP